MDTLMEKISSFVEPLAEWVHKMTFLNAMAEALQVLLPITVIGSFACLFAFIDVGGWQAFLGANPIYTGCDRSDRRITLADPTI